MHLLGGRQYIDKSKHKRWKFLQVEDEELPAHRIILTARSPVFRALLNSDMREGKEGVVLIEDVRAPVFRALLHFVYTDMLPEVRCR